MGMSDYDDFPLFKLDPDQQDEPEISKPELLTIKLFKQAIQEADGDQADELLQRFAETVWPNLMRQLVGATAKGGQFTENRRAEGKNVDRSKLGLLVTVMGDGMHRVNRGGHHYV
jgi:CRISPR-associated protein Csc3